MYSKGDVREYLSINFDNLKAAGDKYGVSPSTMSKMQCGRQYPSQAISESINKDRADAWWGTGYTNKGLGL